MSHGPVPAADADPGQVATVASTAIDISAERAATPTGECRLRRCGADGDADEGCMALLLEGRVDDGAVSGHVADTVRPCT